MQWMNSKTVDICTLICLFVIVPSAVESKSWNGYKLQLLYFFIHWLQSQHRIICLLNLDTDKHWWIYLKTGFQSSTYAFSSQHVTPVKTQIFIPSIKIGIVFCMLIFPVQWWHEMNSVHLFKFPVIKLLNVIGLLVLASIRFSFCRFGDLVVSITIFQMVWPWTSLMRFKWH